MKSFSSSDTREQIADRRGLIGPVQARMMDDSIKMNKQRQLPLHQIWKLRLRANETARVSFIDYPLDAQGLPSLGDPLSYYARHRHYLEPEIARRVRMPTGYHICRKDPAFQASDKNMCVLCLSEPRPSTHYVFSLVAVWETGENLFTNGVLRKLETDFDALSKVEIIPWGMPKKNFPLSLESRDFVISRTSEYPSILRTNPHTFKVIVDRASRGDPNYVGVLGKMLDQISGLKGELGPNLTNLFGWV